MWPGFKSRRRSHMWVEFVVGSLPCSERFFSGYSGFPLSSKTNISKFQFDQESGRRRTTLWMCYLQIIIYLFYYFTCLSRPQRPQNRISNCRQNHYHNGRPMFIKIAFRPWCFYLKTLLSASSWSIGSTHECHPSIFYSFQYLTDFPGCVYFHPNLSISPSSLLEFGLSD